MKVLVAVGPHLKTSDSPYHTDPNCSAITESTTYQTVDLQSIPHRRECKHCSGEWSPTNGSLGSDECPVCGRDFEMTSARYRHILIEHRDAVEHALGNDPSESTSARGVVADD